MSNKNIQVILPYLPPMEEYIKELKSIWENKWLTNSGPKHEKLQELLKNYMKVTECELFANGHLALEIALKGLALKGEVITTPFTYASTTQAIVNCGLTPVFCDIKEDDYCIDADKIEELITEKTVAILSVHVYGNICDYKKIRNIAQKYNLKVIYDAAHAFGEFVDGVSVGSLGDVSMFSFHATKVYNTVEGGCLTFSNEKLKNDFIALRQFGMYGKENAELLGINAKMTEFHAAMGICNLRHVDQNIQKRKRAYKYYEELLGHAKGIKLIKQKDNIEYNYSYLPIIVDDDVLNINRDYIEKVLNQNNIYPRKYFYPITSKFSAYNNLFEIQPTPVAEKISNKVLTLPLYPELSKEEIEKICRIVLKEVQK